MAMAAVWQQNKEKFLKVFRANQTVIVVDDTLSDKTTQIPQFVLEEVAAGKGRIACILPRRVAAISASERVAEEMDVNIGEEVGYSVPFEERTSSKTIIKYLTDGMLLREAMAGDRLLERYRVIIVDGAHERSLATDILFGFLKQMVMKNRPELKLVVMGSAATLEADRKFENYFHGTPLIKIPPAMLLHPVEIFYTAEGQINYLKAAIKTVVQMHICEPPGDILVFVTGEEEIEQACREIKRELENINKHLEEEVVGPQYKMQIFGDPERRIVVSTQIAAENSPTIIDGIVYVLDSGLAKYRVYDPRLGLDSLVVTPISQASADWRLGCAGRTRPGKCFRLYTQTVFDLYLPPHTLPEIRSTNLVNTLLTLKKLGIEDLLHFDFMDPPNPETLMRALEMLNHSGALDDHGNLTEVGESMSESPAIINWLHLLALDQ